MAVLFKVRCAPRLQSASSGCAACHMRSYSRRLRAKQTNGGGGGACSFVVGEPAAAAAAQRVNWADQICSESCQLHAAVGATFAVRCSSPAATFDEPLRGAVCRLQGEFAPPGERLMMRLAELRRQRRREQRLSAIQMRQR